MDIYWFTIDLLAVLGLFNVVIIPALMDGPTKTTNFLISKEWLPSTPEIRDELIDAFHLPTATRQLPSSSIGAVFSGSDTLLPQAIFIALLWFSFVLIITGVTFWLVIARSPLLDPIKPPRAFVDQGTNTETALYVDEGMQTLMVDHADKATQTPAVKYANKATQTDEIRYVDSETQTLDTIKGLDDLAADLKRQQDLFNGLLAWTERYLPNFTARAMNRLSGSAVLSTPPELARQGVDEQDMADLLAVLEDVKLDVAHVHALRLEKDGKHDECTLVALERQHQRPSTPTKASTVDPEASETKPPKGKRTRGTRAGKKEKMRREAAAIAAANSVVPAPPETTTVPPVTPDGSPASPRVRLPPPPGSW